MAWLNLREEIEAEFAELDIVYEDFRNKWQSKLSDERRASIADTKRRWRRFNRARITAQERKKYHSNPEYWRARARAHYQRRKERTDEAYLAKKRKWSLDYYYRHLEACRVRCREYYRARAQAPEFLARERERSKRYRQAHPERVKQAWQAYYRKVQSDPERAAKHRETKVKARQNWAKANPDRVRETRRRYLEKLKRDPERYAAFLDKQRARDRKRYEVTREQRLAQKRARRAAKLEEYRAKDKTYRETHLEEARRKDRLRVKELKLRDPEAYARRMERIDKWRKEHPDEIREHRRRAKRKQADKRKQEREAA